MMPVLRQARARGLGRLLSEQKDFYAKGWAPPEVWRWQLQAFNAQWAMLCRTVPYFQLLQRSERLPEAFSSWDQFRELVPLMDRKTVQTCRQALTSTLRQPDQWRSTGGSTAEPLQVPVWTSESRMAASDMWYARGWFGVAPSDRLFLIWGHSHLLGSGIRGWWNRIRRQLHDRLLGYYRFSAYDLSDRRLAEAAEAILRFRPAYVLGYSVALDRFARANRRHQAAFHKLGLKVAIATAESFPRPDSARVISEVLGCPVAMEYGAVETGPLAHQRPDGRFQVFWRHYFLERRPSEHLPGASEVLVTSLYPRSLPLVRYRIGDLISDHPNDAPFPLGFDAVTGRCNDYVLLPGGSVIHSEAFTHAVKECSAISSYQVVQHDDRAITLYYLADRPLNSAVLAQVRSRLGRIHPDLAGIRIEHSAGFATTIAGKTRRVIRSAHVDGGFRNSNLEFRNPQSAIRNPRSD